MLREGDLERRPHDSKVGASEDERVSEVGGRPMISG